MSSPKYTVGFKYKYIRTTCMCRIAIFALSCKGISVKTVTILNSWFVLSVECKYQPKFFF